MEETAVDKALGVLRLLIEHPEGIPLPDLVQRTGYPRPTVYRLVRTLVRNGFARQETITGRYTVGGEFLRAFRGIARGLGLRDRALPLLKKLTQATGHAANLAVLRGDQVLYLESTVADSSGPILYMQPGTHMPPHATSLGKVMLADLLDSELEPYLRTLPLVAHTPNTITSLPQLLDHLMDVRQRDYAVDDEEATIGVRCVAAPLRDYTGRVVAAISISAPIHELPQERIPAVANLVVETARALSVDLGFDPSLREPRAVSTVARKRLQ